MITVGRNGEFEALHTMPLPRRGTHARAETARLDLDCPRSLGSCRATGREADQIARAGLPRRAPISRQFAVDAGTSPSISTQLSVASQHATLFTCIEPE